MAIAIEIEGLSKQYQMGAAHADTLRERLANIFRSERTDEETFWALKDVSFTLEQGESLGIIGRNGAGKSTLLKILSKITRPSAGEVRLHQRVSSLLEVGTGFHPELTGRENIYLNGSILGMTRKEIKARFDEIVEFSGIERFLDTPVKRYSSGMYVRLAFSVAAHLEPEILIVDEVLAVGDAEFQKKCLGKLDDVASSGRTIIFVSHNSEAIRSMCSRVIWLDKGEIKKDGTAREVVSAYLSDLRTKSESVAPGDRTDRSGSGLLKVNTIEISNPDGTIIESGMPLQIKVSYKGDSAGELMCLAAVGIHDQDGMRMGTLSTKFFKELVRLKDGSTLVWTVPKLSLAPGKYSINTFLGHRSEHDIIDHVQQVSTFEVNASRFFSESDEPFYVHDHVYFDHQFEVA